ncbi:LAFA_0F22738g1_1 [Lachancea sp. 'fantastica']|nr:LAFA_0F22738g1_1 [Lachancea sp. 'fantastica']
MVCEGIDIPAIRLVLMVGYVPSVPTYIQMAGRLRSSGVCITLWNKACLYQESISVFESGRMISEFYGLAEESTQEMAHDTGHISLQIPTQESTMNTSSLPTSPIFTQETSFEASQSTSQLNPPPAALRIPIHKGSHHATTHLLLSPRDAQVSLQWRSRLVRIPADPMFTGLYSLQHGPPVFQLSLGARRRRVCMQVLSDEDRHVLVLGQDDVDRTAGSGCSLDCANGVQRSGVPGMGAKV